MTNKISVAALIFCVGIFGYLAFVNVTRPPANQKYKIQSPELSTQYCVAPPELMGEGCLRFRNHENKLMIVCGDSSVTEL